MRTPLGTLEEVTGGGVVSGILISEITPDVTGGSVESGFLTSEITPDATNDD